jgi:hypothetical protein
MTRRDVQATLQDLFGVDIGVGSVQKAWEETADAHDVSTPYPSRTTWKPSSLPMRPAARKWSPQKMTRCSPDE